MSLNRISRFAFKVWLKRRQRISVQYFRRYTISNEDVERKCKHEDSPRHVRGIGHERIVNECMPLDSTVDRRLLYEMTGFKLDELDYRDESSFDESQDEEEVLAVRRSVARTSSNYTQDNNDGDRYDDGDKS